jgi:hypothetical protein
MKQLKGYLENNLYMNTKEKEVVDEFNRHLIFHALKDDIECSFSNYLRLFNCLNYLSWAIGLSTADCKVLSVANEDDVQKVWVDYMNVLVASEALIETKSRILKCEVNSFKPYLDANTIHIMQRPELLVKKALEFFELAKKKAH